MEKSPVMKQKTSRPQQNVSATNARMCATAPAHANVSAEEARRLPRSACETSRHTEPMVTPAKAMTRPNKPKVDTL